MLAAALALQTPVLNYLPCIVYQRIDPGSPARLEVWICCFNLTGKLGLLSDPTDKRVSVADSMQLSRPSNFVGPVYHIAVLFQG